MRCAWLVVFASCDELAACPFVYEIVNGEPLFARGFDNSMGPQE